MRYWTLRSDINIDYLAKVELLKTRLNRLLVFKEAQKFIWQKTVSMFNKVKHDGNEFNFRKNTTNIMINKSNNKPGFFPSCHVFITSSPKVTKNQKCYEQNNNELLATKLCYLEATQLVLA